MTEDESVTMSDELTPKYEQKSSNIIAGGSIQSEDSSLIDIDLDDETLRRLFIGNELAFKLITKWSQDPVEKGWTVETNDDSDFAQQVEAWKQELKFDKKLMDLNKFVNVFGSAGFGYNLVDSSSSPDQQVRPEDVEDITKINIIRQDQIEDYEMDGGNIEYYDLEEGYDVDRIHTSRLYHARYYHIRGHPEGFGLLHPLFTSLKVFENVKFGMGQAFYVGGTGFPVLNVKGLDNMDDNDAEELKSEFMSDVLKNPGMMLDKEKADVEFKGSQGKALDPEPYVGSLLDIIGTVVGSKRILTGSEPGGVEGSQTDKEEYFGDVSSFQQNKLTPIVRDFIDRLIEYGLVDEPEDGYRVEWNELYEKDEERVAEINKKKSTALLNMTSAGVPIDVAAEEVGLSEDAVEALQEEGGSQGGSSSGNFSNGPGSEGGSGPQTQGNSDVDADAGDPQNDNTVFYDKDATKETIKIMRSLDGYDSESYWSDEHQHGPGQGQDKITKPIHWSKPLYSEYMDLREELQEEIFGDFVDRVIEAVDESSRGSNDSVGDKIKSFFQGDNQKKLDEYAFSKKVEQELDKMEEDAREATREGLKGSFQVGADKGAAVFNAGTTEVFDKHRRELLDETFDQYITPAYSDTKKEISEKINESVRDYFEDQDKGVHELKRSIREIKGGSSAVDYRFERIARTETGRVRNVGYIDETSRRGRSMYDWVGPAIEETTPPICQRLTADSPMSKEKLMRLTDGGMPHISCRRTAAVATDALIGDDDLGLEVLLYQLQDQFNNRDVEVLEEDQDLVRARFENMLNMDEEDLQEWKQDEHSVDPIVDKTLELVSKNPSQWEDEDFEEAARTTLFLGRAVNAADEFSEAATAVLKNWGYDPGR